MTAFRFFPADQQRSATPTRGHDGAAAAFAFIMAVPGGGKSGLVGRLPILASAREGEGS